MIPKYHCGFVFLVINDGVHFFISLDVCVSFEKSHCPWKDGMRSSIVVLKFLGPKNKN